MKKLKEIKGITLVALTITIIILIILAGVTILQLTKNGLLNNVEIAKEKAENAQAKEDEILQGYDYIINTGYRGEEVTFKTATTLPIIISNILEDSFTINIKNVEDIKYKTLKYYVNETVVYTGTDSSFNVTEINGQKIKANETYNVFVLAEPFMVNVATIPSDNVDSWLACIGYNNNGKYSLDNIQELFANEELLIDLITSDSAFDYLTASTEKILPKFYTDINVINTICKNTDALAVVCENESMIKTFIEQQEFRTAMYDNAEITESVLANSTTALEAMKASSRYASAATAKLNSSSTTKTVYEGKAFVFTCSAYSNEQYSIYLIAGDFIVGDTIVTGRGSSGKTLTMTLNKFASSVTGKRYKGYDARAVTLTYFMI